MLLRFKQFFVRIFLALPYIFHIYANKEVKLTIFFFNMLHKCFDFTWG